MDSHILKGLWGERLAAAYLDKEGYLLLQANWRSGRYEIDLIAQKGGVIHFIEVKTRHTLAFGFPEEHVTRKKFRHLQSAAAAYLEMHPDNRRIQFDIVAITRLARQRDQILLIEDVFLF